MAVLTQRLSKIRALFGRNPAESKDIDERRQLITTHLHSKSGIWRLGFIFSKYSVSKSFIIT